ncbi:MAG: hypothetical protein ABSF45_10515 [Terriglobia bacterium]|jgi:hypothetical protein
MLTRRAHVVLPKDLVIQIDALVGKRRRSAFLTEIARREVKRRRLQAFLASETPAWNPDDHPEIDAAGGAAAWVKKMRHESDQASLRRIRRARL